MAGALVCGGGTIAQAQTSAIASGNWSAPATWSGGEPVLGVAATIDGGLTVTADQAGEVAGTVDLGTIAGQTGNLVIAPGADLAASGGALPSIRVGQAAGATGVVNMSGGTVVVDGAAGSGIGIGELIVGDAGAGAMSMSGGELVANDEIFIGLAEGSSGQVDVSGGVFRTAGRSILVGFDGVGTLNVSGGGSVVANHDLLLGFHEGSTAAVNLSGGTIEAGFMFSNSFTGGTGSTVTMTQTGGAFNARLAYVLGQGVGSSVLTHSGGAINALTNNGDMVVSDGNGNSSTYNVSGAASVNLLHNFIVAAFGGSNGTVNQTGGAIDVGDNVFLGRDAIGAWNLSAGTVDAGLDIVLANFSDGSNGTVNQSGGAVTAGGNVVVGRDGSGVWNLSGGTLSAANVFLGDFDTSQGTMTITGGTLSLSGNLNVGAALASNAPAAPVGDQGQALDANGTLVVSGPGGVVHVSGNLLANDGDHFRLRPDLTGDNVSTLVFEVHSSGISTIEVDGFADLTGADVDVDLLSAFPPGTTFDLIRATDISEDYFPAPEDVGAISLAVFETRSGDILRATVVPEPAAAVVAALAALGLVAGGRREFR